MSRRQGTFSQTLRYASDNPAITLSAVLAGSGAFALTIVGALSADNLTVVAATAAGSVLLITTQFLWASRRRRKALEQAGEDPGERLRRRVESVSAAFTEAVTLMDDLRRDVEAQQATRQALITEAERQQQLLAVNRGEAERIREILIGETKETLRAERRREWMFFVLGFAASAVVSVPIGILVNRIS
ncbi:hypothetical protein GCM10023193_68220 [Planotetraspora kaengkrachanensis]|uniref:Uncharacterized protein n=1 Tax=Planotetraspora kaengkrachanensis TaxID=575193 RepID=A0A8J3VAE4_9ACTN|nr:hypothetical protein Pka01_64340 [Planotetraspora kaengkrachanensis]